MTQSEKSKATVREAAAYLRHCGIRLPKFRVTTEPPEQGRHGGSYVTGSAPTLRLNMGWYPTAFHRGWFAMHEVGHLLWNLHQPLRWKRFREEFGEPEPEPDVYDGLARDEVWKTAAAWKLSKLRGPHRPKGQPSWYGARGGGQERFCELIGLMWAHGGFDKNPPRDLADLWDVCWEHGLSRMT